jgi:hypothetical protein
MPDYQSEVNPNVRVEKLPASRYRVERYTGEFPSSEDCYVDDILRISIVKKAVWIYDKDRNIVGLGLSGHSSSFRLSDIGVEVYVS